MEVSRQINIDYRKIYLSYCEYWNIFYNDNDEGYIKYTMKDVNIKWYNKEFYPYKSSYNFLIKDENRYETRDEITLKGLITFFLSFLTFSSDRRIKKLINRLITMLSYEKGSTGNISLKYDIVSDRYEQGIISYILNNEKIKKDAIEEKMRGEWY